MLIFLPLLLLFTIFHLTLQQDLIIHDLYNTSFSGWTCDSDIGSSPGAIQLACNAYDMLYFSTSYIQRVYFFPPPHTTLALHISLGIYSLIRSTSSPANITIFINGVIVVSLGFQELQDIYIGYKCPTINYQDYVTYVDFIIGWTPFITMLNITILNNTPNLLALGAGDLYVYTLNETEQLPNPSYSEFNYDSQVYSNWRRSYSPISISNCRHNYMNVDYWNDAKKMYSFVLDPLYVGIVFDFELFMYTTEMNPILNFYFGQLHFQILTTSFQYFNTDCSSSKSANFTYFLPLTSGPYIQYIVFNTSSLSTRWSIGNVMMAPVTFRPTTYPPLPVYDLQPNTITFPNWRNSLGPYASSFSNCKKTLMEVMNSDEVAKTYSFISNYGSVSLSMEVWAFWDWEASISFITISVNDNKIANFDSASLIWSAACSGFYQTIIQEIPIGSRNGILTIRVSYVGNILVDSIGITNVSITQAPPLGSQMTYNIYPTPTSSTLNTSSTGPIIKIPETSYTEKNNGAVVALAVILPLLALGCVGFFVRKWLIKRKEKIKMDKEWEQMHGRGREIRNRKGFDNVILGGQTISILQRNKNDKKIRIASIPTLGTEGSLRNVSRGYRGDMISKQDFATQLDDDIENDSGIIR